MFEQVLAALPWIVVLAIYVGEKLQQWRMIRAVDDALARAQAPAAAPAPRLPAPAPTAPTATAAAPASHPETPAAPVTPAASGPFATAPKWFQWAVPEIGAHEDPGNMGAAVRRYVSLAHCGAEGDAVVHHIRQCGAGIGRNHRHPLAVLAVVPQ